MDGFERSPAVAAVATVLFESAVRVVDAGAGIARADVLGSCHALVRERNLPAGQSRVVARIVDTLTIGPGARGEGRQAGRAGSQVGAGRLLKDDGRRIVLQVAAVLAVATDVVVVDLHRHGVGRTLRLLPHLPLGGHRGEGHHPYLDLRLAGVDQGLVGAVLPRVGDVPLPQSVGDLDGHVGELVIESVVSEDAVSVDVGPQWTASEWHCADHVDVLAVGSHTAAGGVRNRGRPPGADRVGRFEARTVVVSEGRVAQFLGVGVRFSRRIVRILSTRPVAAVGALRRPVSPCVDHPRLTDVEIDAAHCAVRSGLDGHGPPRLRSLALPDAAHIEMHKLVPVVGVIVFRNRGFLDIQLQ
mmetsp:Transcript_34325/g.102822  ORF Transcript_34325/g.102822 Transcript_34325/m.102822 type:complete len:357 (-) Transcript_34325:156-1226(-)